MLLDVNSREMVSLHIFFFCCLKTRRAVMLLETPPLELTQYFEMPGKRSLLSDRVGTLVPGGGRSPVTRERQRETHTHRERERERDRVLADRAVL